MQQGFNLLNNTPIGWLHHQTNDDSSSNHEHLHCEPPSSRQRHQLSNTPQAATVISFHFLILLVGSKRLWGKQQHLQAVVKVMRRVQ